jgi:hypothetical protein
MSLCLIVRRVALPEVHKKMTSVTPAILAPNQSSHGLWLHLRATPEDSNWVGAPQYAQNNGHMPRLRGRYAWLLLSVTNKLLCTPHRHNVMRRYCDASSHQISKRMDVGYDGAHRSKAGAISAEKR